MAIRQMSKVIDHLRRAVVVGGEHDRTDGQLLERFVSYHDEAAVAALVRRHGPMVWGVCHRVLSNHHDAEDAFQATFLVFVRKAASIVPREMVPNWLYGVAHRTALKARATMAKRQAREKQVNKMPEPEVGTEPELWRDLQPLLDQELSRLPPKYRVAIILCDLEGRSRTAVARRLKIPEGTLSSRLTTARRMLAKRLARHGLSVSGGALAVMLSSHASAGVPTSVVSSTIKAVTLIAAGQGAATGLISVKVAVLTEGVLKSMLLTKLKIIMMLVGLLGIIGLGLGLSAYHGFAQQSGNENNKALIKRGAEAPATKDAAKPDEKKSEAHYCWLVFGPKAKVRALVRLDGEEVAVNRDGDGKFDGQGERFKSEKDCKDVVIPDPDGKTSYVITYVHALHVVPPEKFLEVRVHVRGTLNFPQGCIVQMADDRKTAPEARFNGPLTIAPKGWRIVNRASRLVENDLVDLESVLPQSVKRLAGKGDRRGVNAAQIPQEDWRANESVGGSRD